MKQIYSPSGILAAKPFKHVVMQAILFFIALLLAVVLPSKLFAQGTTFCNSDGTITASSIGVASPYPSNIVVSGVSGTISALTVDIDGFQSGKPSSVELLLVGPGGQTLLLLNGYGGAGASPYNIGTITFSDNAASAIPTNLSAGGGTFKPTAVALFTPMNSPAPAGPNLPAPGGGATLNSVFSGISPNGTWQLYEQDLYVDTEPTLISGWCLNFTITPPVGTITAITSTTNPTFTTAPGNGTTFTATVTSSGNPVTTGTVSFTSNGTAIGTAVALNSSGQAAVTTSFSPAGAYTIQATYNGTANFASSNGSLTQNVNPHLPVISYTSPQTYTVGTAISTLTPGNTGGAVPADGYSNTPVVLASGLNAPAGVAADAVSVYVACSGNGVVNKIPIDGDPPVALASGFNHLFGVAVDAAWVYVADAGNNAVEKIPISGGPPTPISGGFLIAPVGVAVDAASNVYVVCLGSGVVTKILAGGGPPVTIASGFVALRSIAADAAGNLYVADAGNATVSEIPAGGGAPVVIGTGFINPTGVALDAYGNVFVTFGNNTISEIPAGGGAPVVVGAGFNQPTGVALYGGDFYVISQSNNTLTKTTHVSGFYISPFLPAGLRFNNITGVISGTPTAASPATNYTVTAYNSGGSGTAPLNIKVNPHLPPVISYTSPQTYTVGTAISTLTPGNTGSAVPADGYSNTPVVLASGLNAPAGVAADAVSVYVACSGNGVVNKIPIDGGPPVALASGFNHLFGVAVDPAWVYVADAGDNAVMKIPISGGPPTPVIGGLSTAPVGVAVDAASNVYVVCLGSGVVTKILAGGGPPVTIASGFVAPRSIAADAAGNLYVADAGNATVSEIPAGGGAPVVIGTGFINPTGVALDAYGNVFVTFGNNTISEIPAGGGAPVVVGAGFNQPTGVALYGGDFYVISQSNNTLTKTTHVSGFYISPFLPAGLRFNNITGVISGTPTAASPATDYTVTAFNSEGSGTAPLNITVNPHLPPAISYASPQTYTVGTAISTLTPGNTGSAVPADGYSNTPVLLASGLNAPGGVAADAVSVYVACSGNGVVNKIPIGGGPPVTLASGFNHLFGVAVDPAWVYVADAGDNAVMKIPISGGPPTPISGGFLTAPVGVAVDGAGNVYVVCLGSGVVTKILAGGGPPVTIASGFVAPRSIAADAAGNLYVADAGNATVSEIPAGGGAPVVIGTGFINPTGVALDAYGNVFVTFGNNTISKIPAGGGAPVVVGAGFNQPTGVALYGGDFYVISQSNNTLTKTKQASGFYISPFLPAGLRFNNITGVISGTPTAASPATDYTVTAFNSEGSGTAPLNITVVNVNTTVNSIAAVSPSPTNAATVQYTATFGALVSAITAGNFSLTPTGAVSGASIGAITGVGTNTLTITVNTGTGDGTIGLNLDNATGMTPGISTPLPFAGAVYTIDKTPPTVSTITATTPANTSPTNATQVSYTVTFSEPVTGVSANDFLLTTTNTPGGTALTTTGIGLVSGSGTTYTVTIGGIGGDGTLRLDLISSAPGITDAAGNAISGGFTGGDTYTIDNTAPAVVSFTKSDPDPTNKTTLHYQLTFSEPVTGVDASNFTVSAEGLTTGTITVSAVSPTVYNITVNNVTGDGTLQVALNNGFVSISDLAGNNLAEGATSDIYNVHQNPPVVNAITATTPSNANPTNATSVTYTVTFSEAVTGVNTSDFAVTTSGTASGAVTNVSGSFAAYTVTVSGISGTGTLRLDLNNGTGIQDAAGNAASGFTGGDTYTIDNTPPTVTIGSPSQSITSAGPVSYTVTYADANFNTSTLSPSNITLNATGTATGTVGVSGSGTSYTVTISGITGYGSLGISIAAGTASDLAGNLAPAAGPSATFAISSTDATLGSLSTGTGTLSPSFTSGQTTYTETVPNTTTSITVKPTANNTNAKSITVTAGGVTSTVSSGSSSPAIALAIGANIITVKITAQDGVTTDTYTITVTRTGSSNANLSNLVVLSSCTLKPAFSANTTSYTASVSNTVTSVTVTPITQDPTATVKVNGTTVKSGSASGPVALIVGANTITIVVTAQDGITIKTYTVIVTRAPSSNANLSNLAISPGTLTPAFSTNTIAYSATVSNTTTSLTVTPTTSDPTATIKVNGTTVISGKASGAIALAVGKNTINTVVTAQDGQTTKTYCITVTRTGSAIATLSKLAISSGTLAPVFATGTTSYTASVTNATTSITVTPTTSDPTATVKVNGTTVKSG